MKTKVNTKIVKKSEYLILDNYLEFLWLTFRQIFIIVLSNNLIFYSKNMGIEIFGK